MDNVEVDGSGMLPGPVVTFVLGLYNAILWSESLVDNGAGDLFIFCWGQEQHFLGWDLTLIAVWHCGLYLSVAFGSVSSTAGNCRHAPCQQGSKAYWDAGKSYCAGSP